MDSPARPSRRRVDPDLPDEDLTAGPDGLRVQRSSSTAIPRRRDDRPWHLQARIAGPRAPGGRADAEVIGSGDDVVRPFAIAPPVVAVRANDDKEMTSPARAARSGRAMLKGAAGRHRRQGRLHRPLFVQIAVQGRRRDRCRGPDRRHHAACYSDGASAALTKRQPTRTRSRPRQPSPCASSTGAHTTIAKIDLDVTGSVPGDRGVKISRDRRGGEEGLPVSRALAEVPEINLEARLG